MPRPALAGPLDDPSARRLVGRTSPDFDRLDRRLLVDPAGVTFTDFRRRLTPRWGIVWGQLLAAYAALFVVAGTIVWFHRRAPGMDVPAVVLGALAFGYVIAYVELFIHEAAHWNVAPTRRWNDLLANVFVGSLIGHDVAGYRAIHFEHHRSLGTPADPEASYFEALTPCFLLESLTGIRALRTFLARRTRDADGGAPSTRWIGPLCAILVHGSVLGASWLLASWALALAWMAGVALVYPFFGALRQLLEHRDERAAPGTDYRQVPHGPINRLFGDGPLASTFGGAGFNRHLLHHWEPQLSYTRLRELEAFLLRTPAAAAVRAHQTTYVGTFLRLLRAGTARA